MTTLQLDPTGGLIGNYRVRRVIGEGSFGKVYEATHQNIEGRRAAIKVLHPHLALQEDLKRRFIKEATAASLAEHPNIVRVLDAGVTERGLCFVIMEYLDGVPLSHRLRQGPLPLGRALHVALQIAQALSAAHRQGIVHRDLKPDNIFLVRRDGDDSVVKVLDFGVAKLHGSEQRTATGLWMGTPAYMSPEQWMTLPDIDGRADLYSLGIILYECITGSAPFTGATPYSLQVAHLQTDPPPLPPQCPAALADVLRRLMAKDRALRYADAEELCATLRSLGPHRTVDMPTIIAAPDLPAPPARAPAATDPSRGSSGVSRPQPPPTTLGLGAGALQQPRRQRRRGLAVAGALALATAAAGLLARRPAPAGRTAPAVSAAGSSLVPAGPPRPPLTLGAPEAAPASVSPRAAPPPGGSPSASREPPRRAALDRKPRFASPPQAPERSQSQPAVRIGPTAAPTPDAGARPKEMEASVQQPRQGPPPGERERPGAMTADAALQAAAEQAWEAEAMKTRRSARLRAQRALCETYIVKHRVQSQLFLSTYGPAGRCWSGEDALAGRCAERCQELMSR